MAVNKELQEQFFTDVLGEKIAETPKPEEKKTEIPATPAAEEKKVEEPPKTEVKADLTDAEILAMLEKRGIKVNSFDDLKKPETPEEIAARAEKRKNDALAWGLQNGKVKKEDYDTFQKLNTNKYQVLFDDFAAIAKEQDPAATDEDIQNNFQEYIQNNKKFLEELADSRIKNKFSPIFNLENEYTKFEESENSKSNLKRQVEAAMPVYKSDVKTALNSIKKIDFVIEDKENTSNNVPVSFEFTDADLKEVEDALFDGNQALTRIKNGYSQDTIKQEARLFLIDKKLSQLVTTAAKNYNSAQKEKYFMARKNTNLQREFDISTPDLKTDRDKIYEELVASVTPAAPQPSSK